MQFSLAVWYLIQLVELDKIINVHRYRCAWVCFLFDSTANQCSVLKGELPSMFHRMTVLRKGIQFITTVARLDAFRVKPAANCFEFGISTHAYTSPYRSSGVLQGRR